MIAHALAARYARVLFRLDLPQDVLAKRLTDFEALQALLADYPKLMKLLKSPQLERGEKQKILEEALKEHGDKRFIQFILFLIEKKRINYLDVIAVEYRERVDEHLGIWEAEITTAVEMDQELEAKLKAKLENHFHKKVTIKKVVDPTIVGGAMLFVDNALIDWSVKGRLRQMKEKLQEIKNVI